MNSFLKPRISKKYLHTVLFILILAIGFFYRFYNTPARYGFDYDATRDALIAVEGARHLQLPLIGAPVSVGPFTFGPWYYIQLILFRFMFPFDYAAWIYMGILSLISIVIFYKIGELLEGKTFGLLLSGISSVATSQIVLATGLSNPNAVSICAAVAFWIFLKYINQELSFWWLFFWGIVLGIGLNNHYQMIGLFVLPIIAILYKRKKIIRHVSTLAIGIFLTFLPLLYFDLINNWYNLKGIALYITGNGYKTYVANRWLFYIRDFWPSFWANTLGIPLYFSILLIIGFIVLIGYLMFTRKLSISHKLLLMAFIINFFQFRYFSGERAVYYLYYLQPYILIFTALLIWYSFKFKKGIYVGFFFLFILLIFIVPKDNIQLDSKESYVNFNHQVESLIMRYPDKKFTVFNCKKNDSNGAQAIAFILNNKNKLDEKGVKVGFMGNECAYPDLEDHRFIKGTEALDFSRISKKSLIESGFIEISPITVYLAITEWWKNE